MTALCRWLARAAGSFVGETEVMERQGVAAEEVFEAGAAPAAESGGARDEPQGVAVGAEVGDEMLELFERERPGTPALADGREDRMVVAKTGHRA